MKRRIRQIAARLPVAWTEVAWFPPIARLARGWGRELAPHSENPDAAAARSALRRSLHIRFSPSSTNFSNA